MERCVRFILVMTTGRAMSFVTDHKTNFVHTVLLLSLAHHFNRLISRENNRHSILQSSSFHFFSQCISSCCRRIAKVAHRRYFIDIVQISFSSCRVRTYCKCVDRNTALSFPIGECLRKKSKRRHKEHHKAFLTLDLLGNLHGSKGLASSTRHDELATVMVGKPLDYVVYGFFLIRTWLAFCNLFNFSLCRVCIPVN